MKITVIIEDKEEVFESTNELEQKFLDITEGEEDTAEVLFSLVEKTMNEVLDKYMKKTFE